ncbi:hypothetical protein ASO20_01290 [Mycoplasma sp. (ex Biomphalaria glabrata)]|uniref:prolipoprotein diacylglyceryl transferase n=1 Tax=Mycoplasma sp. (ex Biomphalaria glabrata) TaxID=1749074 RepID=UPI00073A78EE|nr:prolipoprotein diacylglyceryl transferase [Mycoplasma sp. (ex Biomphalaria glabrata)]ALV23290.1 hypothetical protein ASO20_01290 [Mycoplasma sp. (ex Biomphalaria glabrata)]
MFLSDIKIAFSIGSWNISWYSIFIFLAFITAYGIAIWRTKRLQLPTKPVENFIYVLLPTSIIFARIWYVLGDLSQYSNFMQVLDISRGGIAIEGGVIGGLISGFIWFRHYSRKYEVSIWKYADAIMPGVLIGQALGRWGNFFNQEILGPIDTNHYWSWLPPFIKNYLHLPWEGSGIVRVPLFLIESSTNLIGFIVIVFILPKIKLFKNVNGSLFFAYFAWYGCARLILEPFRYSDFIMRIGGFPISIFLSCVFLIIGIIGIIIVNVFKKYNLRIISNISYRKEMKIKIDLGKILLVKLKPKIESTAGIETSSNNDIDNQIGNVNLDKILKGE